MASLATLGRTPFDPVASLLQDSVTTLTGRVILVAGSGGTASTLAEALRRRRTSGSGRSKRLRLPYERPQ
jgi:hypothetical protein